MAKSRLSRFLIVIYGSDFLLRDFARRLERLNEIKEFNYKQELLNLLLDLKVLKRLLLLHKQLKNVRFSLLNFVVSIIVS